MKIQSRRAFIVLLMLLMFMVGLAFFIGSYLKNASTWANFAANKHLYSNGQPNNVTIFDRNGLTLFNAQNGTKKYNSDAAIRTAVMHAVGDSGGNVSTGALVAFRQQMNGWNFLNGTYRFGSNGNSISLTIDASLCKTAYEALAGRKGTVGIYNYKTGDIICMVSSPSFDPENPPKIDANSDKYKGIYVNRFISATYTPGSVFKLVTVAAALDTIPDVSSRTFNCTGKVIIDGGKVTCEFAHGKQNLGQALANSCNITFAELADEVGAKTLQSYAQKAGFNSNMYVDGIKCARGKVDLSTADKLNLGWAGVGQYTDTANPLTFMSYMGAIANSGIRITPKLLMSSSSSSTRILSDSTSAAIKSLMRNDTILNYGDRNYPGLNLCAKSGTAQLSDGQLPNAWFAGFLDRSDCPLAFVVVVENGGSGSKVAGPIAGKVLQAAVKSYAGK